MNKIRGLDKLDALRASLPEVPQPQNATEPASHSDQKDVVLHALIDLWVAVHKFKSDLPLPVRAALEKVNKIVRPLLEQQ